MRLRSGRTLNRPRRYCDPYAHIRRNHDCAANVLLREGNNVTEYGAMSDNEDDVEMPQSSDAPTPTVLKVEQIDFMVATNVKTHKTDEYDIVSDQSEKQQLVVRRGEAFRICVKFNRGFMPTEDKLKFIFQIGDNPRESKGTQVNIAVSENVQPGKWTACITSNTGHDLVVDITTPPNCFVGKWKLKLDVIRTEERKNDIFRYNHKEQIYVLFNPWCKDDQTFMPDKNDRGADSNLLDEYIMNETGKIYVGSTKHISSCPWNFGQFEGAVLDCAMALLDDMSETACGDAVKVVRKLTALVNGSDDNGVLTGNWSGDYSGGVSPTTWTGSVAILEEWYNARKPVCFGQCWVFSGVLTSVLRSLGIPARSVTNFASAHDTDGSITIDAHFNEKGDVVEDMNDDSVWNFHVWNEAYMSRPDLPKGYGGWQACDSTPQEVSDGIFCCGPASVRAIKHGEIQLLHDAPFIFAEVNADRVYWEVSKDGTTKNVGVSARSIGKFISTKKPGRIAVNDRGKRDPDRHDVTLRYKYPEGSQEERAAVLRANQACSTRKDIYCANNDNDVKFEIEEYDVLDYGKPFDVRLKIKNLCDSKRTVSGKLSCSSVFYTGVHANLLKKHPFSVTLTGNEETEVKMPVTWKDYGEKIVQHCMLKLSVLCKVDETNQVYADQDDFRLYKPNLTIQASDEATVDEEWHMTISFTNPLPVTLTNCELVMDGPGLQKPVSVQQSNVAAHDTFRTSFFMTPTKTGQRNAILNFTSKELEGITGVAAVTVKS